MHRERGGDIHYGKSYQSDRYALSYRKSLTDKDVVLKGVFTLTLYECCFSFAIHFGRALADQININSTMKNIHQSPSIFGSILLFGLPTTKS